jgi:hypothetical protein
MRLCLFTVLFSVFVLDVTALSFIRRLIIANETPACSSWCSATTAKKLKVSYFDGKGNCARPEFHTEWEKCLHKRCSGRARRHVRTHLEMHLNTIGNLDKMGNMRQLRYRHKRLSKRSLPSSRNNRRITQPNNKPKIVKI